MPVQTEIISTTFGALNNNFSGRHNMPGYDATKSYRIHPRNRAYAWPTEMQQDLVDSIVKGYYINPIICCSSIEGGREIRQVMDGGNRITTVRRILDGLVTKPKGDKLTPGDIDLVKGHVITVVVLRGLTTRDQRDSFRRMNKSVKVSDGQLYAMSDDSLLVQEALAFLNDPQYPLRARITATFFDTVNKDSNSKGNLANAVALISGILHGTKFITKSFDRQDEKVSSTEPIDRAKIVEVFTHLIDIFQAAEARTPHVTSKARKSFRKKQWSVGKYLDTMLYDLSVNPLEAVQAKWVSYLARIYGGEHELAQEAVVLAGGQNLTIEKFKRKSRKVDVYMRENRLATDAELTAFITAAAVVNPASPDETDDESLEQSDDGAEEE